ncbi:16S rRNA (guanine(527)-N(7))-methyltransferase RsmG [Halanaerobacter jeridensis]|uniref:Ribosomal RNA small subunit methyltransferase G n=1 Tax=Halanaerobacter jeridensis TaxID=706427 RepID=A0A938XWX7_9FIRM|nr:16S rRNA (guanine(527)-N(7))-methyltransferase RsmG [Halanaerobacter jeridensis]MBM7557771.1 16S rRNA (guanine527-N7)-methyltransferase [Halanaerobacter jeridensis]
MSAKNKLKTGAQELGLDLSKEQLDILLEYMDILREWNQKINLTAIDDPEEIVVKHFLDSLSLLQTLDLSGEERVIDIGTGAGFPGLVLKIIYPNLRLTLLDSVKKKVNFLRQAAYQLDLDLDTIEFLHGRAEDLGRNRQHREQYDYAIARAVAYLNILSEYALPFVKEGGQFIAQKGENAKKEVVDSQVALEKLGGETINLAPVDLPYNDDDRYLIVIEKIMATTSQYPRRAGTPKKKPL